MARLVRYFPEGSGFPFPRHDASQWPSINSDADDAAALRADLVHADRVIAPNTTLRLLVSDGTWLRCQDDTPLPPGDVKVVVQSVFDYQQTDEFKTHLKGHMLDWAVQTACRRRVDQAVEGGGLSGFQRAIKRAVQRAAQGSGVEDTAIRRDFNEAVATAEHAFRKSVVIAERDYAAAVEAAARKRDAATATATTDDVAVAAVESGTLCARAAGAFRRWWGPGRDDAVC
jgi:hypothetical protein